MSRDRPYFNQKLWFACVTIQRSFTVHTNDIPSWQFTDTSASTPQDVSSRSGKSAGETMSKGMSLAFENNLQAAVPTGVSTGLSVMVFVILAIIVAAFIFDSKRRKTKRK